MKFRKMLLLLLASPRYASGRFQLPKASALWATETLKRINNLPPVQRAAAGAASVVATYALYSMTVQKYAEHVLRQMMAVLKPDDLELDDVGAANGGADGNNDHPILPSQLRRTVSKYNNLVTNPRDRLRWNQWIARNDQKLDTVEATDVRSLWGTTSGGQTELRFKYRTGANQEEIAALCKPFWTWQRLKFTFSKTGRMVFSEPTDDSKDALANVFIQDYFLIGSRLRVHVTWYGKVVSNRSKNREKKNPNSKHDYKYQIEWTSTEAKSFLPWTKSPKIVLNNEPSKTMSKTPWDIVKMEDKMICLRRGDVGYLVYDSN